MTNVNEDTRLAWGKHLRESLGSLTSLDEIVARRITRQEKLDEALGVARDKSAREQAEVSESVNALTAAAEDAARVLRLVAVKLEALLLEQTIPDAAYKRAVAATYPHGAQSIPSHPGERHAALTRVAQGLKDNAEADPDGLLEKLASGAAAKLSAANAAAKKESEEAREAQSELEHARTTWDEGYLANKDIIGGLLRDAGRRVELATFFSDMQPSAPPAVQTKK